MSAEIIYLVEATDSTGAVYRYCSGIGYMSLPTDTPPNVYYQPRVEQPGLFRQNMFAVGTTSGSSTGGYGEISLINTDGGLDTLVDLGFDGRACIVKEGPAGGSLSMFAVVITGTIEQCELSWNRVTFRLKDNTALLTVPAQSQKYIGNNILPAGVDGVATDLKDKRKPRLFGVCNNVTVPCVNTAKLIYQINSGPVASIVAVHDSGNANQITLGANYATNVLLQAATPAAATYITCLAEGLFRLGSTAFGAVTADVVQGAVAAERTAGQIIRTLAAEAINTTLGAELIVNGTFDLGLTSWTTVAATPSAFANIWTIRNTGAVAGYSYQPIITVAGQKYQFAATAVLDNSGSQGIPKVSAGTSAGDSSLGSMQSGTLIFTATGTTTYINLHVGSPYGGMQNSYDNISVKAYAYVNRITEQSIIDLDKAAPYTVGLFISADETYAACLDVLCGSVGAWWGFDNLGMFWTQQLTPPDVANAIIELTKDEIISIDRTATADGDKGVPVYQVYVDFSKNWTVQSSGLAASVEAAQLTFAPDNLTQLSVSRRNELAMEYIRTYRSNISTLSKHLLASKITLTTTLNDLGDANTEAGRVLQLRQVRRDRLSVKTKIKNVNYPDGGYWDDQAISNIPELKSKFGALVVGSKVYVFGGIASTPWTWTLDVDNPTGQWIMEDTSFNSSFYDFGYASIGSIIYVTGGKPASGYESNCFYYDTTNPLLGWRGGAAVITALPAPVRNHTCVVYNGYLYNIGGQTMTTPTAIVNRLNLSNLLSAWDDAGVTDLPVARMDHCSVVYNGYLYVFGGTISGAASASVIRLNLSAPTGAWDDAGVTDLPVVASDMSAVLRGSTVFLMGTSAGSGVLSLDLNSPTSAWNTSYSNMPGSRLYASSICYKNSIYTLGGWANAASQANTWRLRTNDNPDDVAHKTSMGRTVLIKYPRYGYTSGRPMKIIGTEYDLKNRTTTLDLWG